MKMNRVDNFRIYLDKLTNLTFDIYIKEKNKMGLYGFLLGKGDFKAESFPDAGHNYIEVLNAIYRYDVNNPDINVANMLEETLNLIASHMISVDNFLMLMNYLYLQLDNEKNNKSPFKINVLRILNTLKTRIISTNKLYQDKIFIEQVHQSEHLPRQPQACCS